MELLNFTQTLALAKDSGFISQNEAQKLFVDYLRLYHKLSPSEENTEKVEVEAVK